MSATAGLPSYPCTQVPAAGESIEIAPGVRWLRMPLPFALNHINLWLIADGALVPLALADAAAQDSVVEDALAGAAARDAALTGDTPAGTAPDAAAGGWTIVDTGFALPVVRECWTRILGELAATPQGGRIRRIVVTHFHPDHIGLAEWLQTQTGAPVLMTLGEYLTAHAVWHEIGGHGNAPMQRQFALHGLSPEGAAAIAAGRGGYNRGVPALPTQYRRLLAGDELCIGGRRWQVIVGHGHSPEHAALYCEDDHVLISGDMVLPKISTNISVFAVTPEANSLADFLASLDRLRALPADTLVLPSHGLPFRGLHDRIDALHAHHHERLVRLEAHCTTPHCAAELLPILFERELDAHQTMFAMGEAIAHLNWLEHAGRLRRCRSDDGIIRFMRA
ncbi:MBL fold metallo-hydrolase [Rhodocyclus gracilis]